MLPTSLPSPSPAAAPATTPARKGAAAAGEHDQDADVDLDLLEGAEGAEGSGITEEEKKRIIELREERDGLRGMNRTLEGLLTALRGMDSKLKVRRTPWMLG